jgi:hypothetical protein
VRLEHVQPREAGRLRGEGAVVVHRFRHRQAVHAAQREVVLAVAGRDVDEAVPASVVTKPPGSSGTSKP